MHGVSKHATPLTCCNRDTHQPILIIFGGIVSIVCRGCKQSSVIYFPIHLTNASALPGENLEIMSCHLKLYDALSTNKQNAAELCLGNS